MSPAECRARRVSLGVTEAELARRAGVVEQTVRGFEAGLSKPRPVTLIALRKGFRLLAQERDRQARLPRTA